MPVSERTIWKRALGLALLLAAATPAHADYKRDYAQGVDAAKAGNWGDVENFMNSALKESAEPQAKVKVYGMRFEPYVPQYYLGLAAYKRGDCGSAMKAWADGPTKAIVDGNPALSGPFNEGVRDCGSKVAANPTTPPNNQTASNTPPSNPTTPPPVKPPPTNPTTPPTNPTSPNTNPTTPTTNPTTPPVANNTPPTNPTTPPPTKPPPASDEPPSELLSAYDSYLSGKYSQAAQVNPAQLPDSKAKYQAFLVRAASRYTQSLMAADGASLLAGAEADVRAAKALSPGGTPDPTIFSPRFKQFYSQVR